MAKAEDGGTIQTIWTKNGGGYYAFLAVCTFLWLEVRSLAEAAGEASGLREFLSDQIFETLVTFGIDTIMNSAFAGVWPFLWANEFGLVRAALWVAAGYALWVGVLAWALDRREKAFKKELGL